MKANMINPCYLFILVGILLAFVSALVPHYYTVNRLDIGVLAAGLAPWLVYGFAAPMMRNLVMLPVGLLLVLLHGWLVASERFGDAMPYSNDSIYLLPLITSVVLMPLAYYAWRQENRRMMTAFKKEQHDQ